MIELPKKDGYPTITMEFLKERPLSYSSLSWFAISPAHYIHYLTAPRETTPALLMGGLVDVLLLTPEDYEKKYVIMPKFGTSNKDKAAKEEFFKNNRGRTAITQQMKDEASRIVDALKINPLSRHYLDKITQTQRKMEWKCKETGLPFIAYLDMDIEGEYIGDLKCMADASPDEFNRAAYNFGYHLQVGIYRNGYKEKFFKFPRFFFLVAEKGAPYGVAVYDKLTPDFLKLGEEQFAHLKQEFLFCMENNLWHQSYEFRTVAGGYILDLPGYAKTKLNDR